MLTNPVAMLSRMAFFVILTAGAPVFGAVNFPSTVDKCAELAGAPPRGSGKIGPYSDTQFFGQMQSLLDSFWAGQFAGGLDSDALGATGETARARGFDYWVPHRGYKYPLNIHLYNGTIPLRGCGGFLGLGAQPVVYDSDAREIAVSRRGLGQFLPEEWVMVLAHESGHHVQKNLDIDYFKGMARAEFTTDMNVRYELQADCLAGFFVGRHRELIGDDGLTKTRARLSHTGDADHGTGEQRLNWFNIGYDSGDFHRCDTFSVATKL